MASPRLTLKTPVACSACYSQKHGVPHVDFGAAMEGAQVDPSNPRSAHVDWVILCSDCVRNAHNLLPEQADRVEQLERTIADLTERVTSAEDYSSSLEDAFSRRPAEREPAPKTAPKPRQRKPRYEAPAA